MDNNPILTELRAGRSRIDGAIAVIEGLNSIGRLSRSSPKAVLRRHLLSTL
jgi:hypothetical protein